MKEQKQKERCSYGKKCRFGLKCWQKHSEDEIQYFTAIAGNIDAKKSLINAIETENEPQDIYSIDSVDESSIASHFH